MNPEEIKAAFSAPAFEDFPKNIIEISKVEGAAICTVYPQALIEEHCIIHLEFHGWPTIKHTVVKPSDKQQIPVPKEAFLRYVGQGPVSVKYDVWYRDTVHRGSSDILQVTVV